MIQDIFRDNYTKWLANRNSTFNIYVSLENAVFKPHLSTGHYAYAIDPYPYCIEFLSKVSLNRNINLKFYSDSNDPYISNKMLHFLRNNNVYIKDYQAEFEINLRNSDLIIDSRSGFNQYNDWKNLLNSFNKFNSNEFANDNKYLSKFYEELDEKINNFYDLTDIKEDILSNKIEFQFNRNLFLKDFFKIWNDSNQKQKDCIRTILDKFGLQIN